MVWGRGGRREDPTAAPHRSPSRGGAASRSRRIALVLAGQCSFHTAEQLGDGDTLAACSQGRGGDGGRGVGPHGLGPSPTRGRAPCKGGPGSAAPTGRCTRLGPAFRGRCSAGLQPVGPMSDTPPPKKEAPAACIPLCSQRPSSPGPGSHPYGIPCQSLQPEMMTVPWVPRPCPGHGVVYPKAPGDQQQRRRVIPADPKPGRPSHSI